MGNICCNTFDETNNISDISEIKAKLLEEYKSYLSFIYQLKSNLNSSRVIQDQNLNYENENNNSANKTNNQRFYYVPRNWFEDWEKRIEIIYKTNKLKSFDKNIEIKKEEKIQKFYYEIISDELWLKLCRNHIYKIKSFGPNNKTGIICNNLVIFQFTGDKSNNIEIFFFEKDEDLFFTNLLFSFDKCQNAQNECYNLLRLLKVSPIQEILGNIKYDNKSEQFTAGKNKMIIYNKTRKINEELKSFRKRQYDLTFNGPNSFNKEDSPNIYDNKKIAGYTDMNKSKNTNYEGGGIINLKQKNGESIANISGLEGNPYNDKNLINNALNKNISKTMKIFKNNNYIYPDNNNDKTKTIILSLKNNSLISNKYPEVEYKNNSRNIILNQNEDISTIYDNKLKNSNIFDFFEENQNNKSLFESILYCFFNIKELTNYILNNEEIHKDLNNSFYNEYLKIIEFLYNKNNVINTLNKNKTNNIYNIMDNIEEGKNIPKLISSYPNYDYQKLLSLIIFQYPINIISKIINNFHLELNKLSNNANCNLIQSESEVMINKNEEETKNKKFEDFLKECQKNNESIIFDLFYGIKEIQIICNKCKKKHFKYEIMNLIEISIDKLTEYIITEQNENNKNIISILDCLNYYSKERKENSKKVIDCSYCGEYQSYGYINNICKYPKIFIICFNYFNPYNSPEDSNEISINLDEKIKLLDDNYKLVGVISLKKYKISKVEEDKYIAFCYSGKKWICYDETKINNNFDFNSEKKEIKPIVIFYQRIKE